MKKPVPSRCPAEQGAVQPEDSGEVWGIRHGLFETTHWSVVRAAAGADTPVAVQALETLCRTYWRPVYVFIVREGVAPEEAKDLTQEYFRHLIASHIPAQADAQKGKFRSFLLLTLKHFLTDEARRARRSRSIPSGFLLPLEMSETQPLAEEAWGTRVTPETAFDRSWAQSLVHETQRKLEAECRSAGRHEFFQAARDYLPGGQGQRPYAELADGLGMDLNVAKVRIHRLRKRFGELLREEIAQTVSTSAEVHEELNYLIEVLS